MPRKIDDLFFDITARTGGFTRGLGSAQTSMRKFVGLLTGPAGAVAAVAAFGAAAVAAGIKATRMAASLDSALREVSTLLPGTVANISQLREEVVALSTEVPQTPELLTKGLYQVISAGISDTAEAMDVLRVSSKAAVAGLTDTFTSVDAITTVLNAYGLEAQEASRVSDVLFSTVKAGKTTFGELSSNIGTVATSAALAGVSIEEVGAAMATLTKFTGNTARSATALDALLRSVTSATDEQREAAKKLGVDYTVAAIKAKGFTGFLRDLQKATGGTVEGLAKITTQAEAQRASFVLAGKGISDYEKNLVGASDAAGSTQGAFAKMNGSLENQKKLLGNKINALWLDLGSKLLPNVIDALETINRLLESDAETLARAYERLGLQQEAAAILVAEQRRKIAEQLQGTAGDINEQVANIARAGERFRNTAGGAFALGNIPRAELDRIYPPGLNDALDSGLETQRDILDQTIAEGRELLRNGDLTERQKQELADILSDRIELVGEIDQQIAGERELLRLATERAGVESGDTEDPADPATPLTEAEQKALDLRDAILKAQAALQALGESGTDLFSDVPAIFASLNDQIDAIGESLDADFAQFDLDARLLSAQRAIEGVTRSGASLGQQALAIQGILDQWKISVDQLPPGFREVVQAIIEARGEADDVDQSLKDIINDASFAARGAVELANAFGLVGDEASQVLNQVALIGEGIGRIASGDILGGIGGVASGLGGLVSGLFGGGPSPSEIERDRSLEENSRRLRQLNDRLDILADALRGLPGQLAANLEDALADSADALRQLADGSAFEALRQQARPGGPDDAVREAFAAAGVSITDIEQAAQALGLDVDQLVRLLEGDVLGGAQLDEARQQAEALAEALDIGLAGALDTVRGRLGLLQDSFDLLDIEDPAEKIRLLAQELGKAGTALTPQELQQLSSGDEATIERIFRQIQAGAGRFTSLGAFGDLSFDEFLDVLRQIESLQDDIKRNTDGLGETGDFQNVSAINRLTVEQGDTLIALAGTRNFYLEEISGALGSGVRTPDVTVTDRMLAAAGTIDLDVSGTVVIDVRGDVTPETAPVIADRVAEGFYDALGIDRSLGDRLRRQRTGLGLPPTRTQ